MRSVNQKIAQAKLVDVIFQIVMFPVACLLLASATWQGMDSFYICYVFAGCQVLSCASWMVAPLFIRELMRPDTFRIAFLLNGIVVALAMLNENAFIIVSLAMLAIGPFMGITYFIKTCNDYRHYQKLVHLERNLQIPVSLNNPKHEAA